MENNEVRRLFLLGSASQYLAYFVVLATSAITVPVYLHFLGQDAYGLFISLSSIIGYFAMLDAGIGLTVPKYVAEFNAKGEKQQIETMLSTFLAAYLGILLLALAIGLVVGRYLGGLLRIPESLSGVTPIAFFLLAANFGLSLLTGLFVSIFTGMRKVYVLNIFKSVQLIGVLIVTSVILALGCGLAGLCVGIVSVSFFQFFIAVWLAKRKFPELRVKFGLARWSMLRMIAMPTFHYFVLQTVSLIVLSTDNIVIGAFIGVGAVAPYSIAFRFCSYGTSLIWISSDVLYPFISDWDARGKGHIVKENHRRLMKLTIAVAVQIGLLVVFFGPVVIRLWVGSNNYVGDSVLYMLSVIIVFSSIVHVSSVMLAGIGKHRTIAYMGILEALSNLALSILFVHLFGVFGVALGTVIAGSLTNVWFAPWYACRTLQDNYLRFVTENIMPQLLSGAVAIGVFASICILPPRTTWVRLIAGLLGCLCYVVLIDRYALGEDKQWALGILKQAPGALKRQRGAQGA